MPTGFFRRFWISTTNLFAQYQHSSAAAQDRAAVDGIEIDAVKAAAIHHLGMVGGDLLEEGDSGSGTNRPKHSFRCRALAPLLMGRRLVPKRAAFYPRETPGRLLADAAKGHQLIADVEHHAVVLEKAGHRAHVRGGFVHRDFRRVRR